MSAANKVSVEMTEEQLDALLKSNPSLGNSIKVKNSTNKYRNFVNCESIDSGKKILFNFSGGNSCVYDMLSHTFQHVNANGVYSNFTFSQAELLFSDLKNVFNIYSHLSSNTTGWVSRFFGLFGEYLENRYRRKSAAFINSNMKKVIGLDPVYENTVFRAINRIDKISEIEKVSKDVRFDNWSIVDLRECFHVLNWDFEKINKVFDPWFISHGLENCSVNWSMDYDESYSYDDYDVEDLYEEREDDTNIKLKKYIYGYLTAKENDMLNMFKHAWENHKICVLPRTSDGYFHYEGHELLKEMINEYSYDLNRLFEYLMNDLPAQGIIVCKDNLDTILTLLRDYVRMNMDIGNTKYNKYPKSLKMAHDLAMRNFRVNQSEVLTKLYGKVVGRLKGLEFKEGDYVVVHPKSVKSIVMEGTSLNHCVARYIKDVVDGKTSIMFLRHKDRLNDSLVTLEVKDNRVVQAKGNFNRSPSPEEFAFIGLYSKYLEKVEKGLVVSVAKKKKATKRSAVG